MATLTTLTLDGDGVIDGTIMHDDITSPRYDPPFYTHCNDDPDSSSFDYVANEGSPGTMTARFTLTNVDADFDSMDTFQIRVDREGGFVPGATAVINARVYSGTGTGTPLTDSQQVASFTDLRSVATVVFGSLTGTKAQWDDAEVAFEWQNVSTNGEIIKIYGCDFDGTYTESAPASSTSIFRTTLGVG